MAIQNPPGARPGGTSSALALSVPTVVKASAGTFWNLNIIDIGAAPGYLYDANALPLAVGAAPVAGAVYPSPSNCLGKINPPDATQARQGTSIASPMTNSSFDIPGLGPWPFANGLVFIPGNDGMTVSIAYS